MQSTTHLKRLFILLLLLLLLELAVIEVGVVPGFDQD
jgi:hypothetical protein